MRLPRSKAPVQNFSAFLKGVVRATEETDVLFVDVNVKEAANLALSSRRGNLSSGKFSSSTENNSLRFVAR